MVYRTQRSRLLRSEPFRVKVQDPESVGGWEKADTLYLCLELGKCEDFGSGTIPNAAPVRAPTRDPGSERLSLQPAFQAFHGPTSAHTRRLHSGAGEPRGICGQVGLGVARPMCEADPLRVEEK